MYVYRNSQGRSCNHCHSGKAIRITYSECAFVALGIQPAMRMCIVSSVACPSVQTFSLLSLKRQNFRKKKVIGRKTRVLIFSATFV
jgi:hypothetical protein